SSRWSWRIFPTRREPSRTTSVSVASTAEAKRNGESTWRTWSQSWSPPSNPTTWCSVAATSRSWATCRPAAEPAITPMRFWEAFGFGSNQPIAKESVCQTTPARSRYRKLNSKNKETTMQLGMIGLGRMGANMARRLLRSGHQCVVFNRSPKPVEELVKEHAVGASSRADLVKKLDTPRAIWLMVPAAAVDQSFADVLPLLEAGDILIDGGNSYYVDDIRRAKELAAKKIHYLDVGTSGGIWGLERGYCMMIGGPETAVGRLDPIFKSWAPGLGDIPRTPGRDKIGGTAEQGYLHCGPAGAGHFVKMIHNGIEYGIMAAYAEGMGILRDANIGKRTHDLDAE